MVRVEALAASPGLPPASARQLSPSQGDQEMRISDILAEKNRNLVSIAPGTTIRRAVALMAAERVGALVVQDWDVRLLGIVSEHGIIDGLARWAINFSR
jgi:predicted transcriptional regulator